MLEGRGGKQRKPWEELAHQAVQRAHSLEVSMAPGERLPVPNSLSGACSGLILPAHVGWIDQAESQQPVDPTSDSDPIMHLSL